MQNCTGFIAQTAKAKVVNFGNIQGLLDLFETKYSVEKYMISFFQWVRYGFIFSIHFYKVEYIISVLVGSGICTCGGTLFTILVLQKHNEY